MTARVQTWGDAAAIGLSCLCMIHCLALPLATGMLPMLGLFVEAPWVHWAFAATAGPIAAWSLTRPDASGRRAWPLISLGALGVAMLFLAAAEWPSHEMETPITVVGGLMLSAAHVMNWRRRPHVH